jgi:hypothetical protein
MASPASAVIIRHAVTDNYSDCGASNASVQASRRIYARRRNWKTAAIVLPADGQGELERYAPLCRSDEKAGKTYYRCKLHNRFSCNMIVRTTPEIETGYICIQVFGLEHKHEPDNERFERGLSTQVKKSIEKITKFNITIRPATLHRT